MQKGLKKQKKNILSKVDATTCVCRVIKFVVVIDSKSWRGPRADELKGLLSQQLNISVPQCVFRQCRQRHSSGSVNK